MGIEEHDAEKRGNGETETGEDERYYLPCPKRKNQARVPVNLCERCEFGSDNFTRTDPCWYPAGRTVRKPYRRKGSNVVRRPKVKKIERDGLS